MTPPRSKVPLVLLHGWGVSRQIWAVPDEAGQGLQDQLSDRFEVHVLDLPGYGADREYGVGDSLAEVAQRVLDRAPPRAIWVAWSLGATVAMQVALLAPERMLGIQLISPTVCFGAAESSVQPSPHASLEELKRRFELGYETGLKFFLMLQTQDRPLMRRAMAAMSQLPAPSEGTIERSLQLLIHTDLRNQVGQICVPTQVLVGAVDRVVPVSSSRALFELLNPSELTWKQWVQLEGGHLCFLESRSAYLEALNVLSSRSVACEA